MKDDLSLTGTLVPSYAALGRLTKNVPALGTTDVKSDGTRGVDFEVSGSLGDPYVTVKPASATSSGGRRESGRASRSRARSELRPEPDQKQQKQKQKQKPKPKPKRRPRAAGPADQEPAAE